MRNTINSTDTLIIRSRMSSGAVYTVELQQKCRTDADIQQLIDTVVDDRETVISVWRVESDDLQGDRLNIEDITDRFDTRTTDEIEEQSKRIRIEADHVPHYAGRLQRSHGTINHAQQGITR